MSYVRYIDSYELCQTNVSALRRVKLCTCSKPSITAFEQTGDSVPLQCEVSDAFPGFKLNICWFDGSGTKLTEKQIDVKEGGRSYILNTTVTKTDTYRCVATMEELSHQVYSETYVPVSGSSVVVGLTVGLVVAVLLPLAVVLFLYRRMKRYSVIIWVEEGRDATLPCNINEDKWPQRFEWKKDGQKQVFLYEGSVLSGQDPQFTGRVSHSDAELMNGDASITIRETKVVDSGVYTCNLPNLHQTFSVKLVVGDELRDWCLEFPGMNRRPSNDPESQPMNQVN